jgi:hypothetical protein
MRRVLSFVAVVLAVLLLFWAAIHVMTTKVNPAQEAPKDHFGGPCWACHIVISGAELIEE